MLSKESSLEWKLKAEVQEQRRQENARRRIQPENGPVKSIELPCIAVSEQYERNQAHEIEMHARAARESA